MARIDYAAVVELVDTPDSKSCELMLVPVQVRPAVPYKNLILYATFSLVLSITVRFLNSIFRLVYPNIENLNYQAI